MTVPGQSDAIAETIAPHERASATPVTRVRSSPQPSTAASDEAFAASESVSLCAQQTWFARAVMTPESESVPLGGADAHRILTAGPRLTAIERLEVYRRAYHARLIECLTDDYPALERALGAETFDALCRAYIDRHPSSGSNLNSFGRHMAAFCRANATAFRESEFAADLASLEWAIVEVIHAPSTEPLTPEGLGSIPMDRWADARLIVTPAFRLLRFSYPIYGYFQAFREGAGPSLPARADSAALVYRSGPTVWRMSLTDPMFELLTAIASGQSLGESVERGAAAFEDVDEEVAATRMMVWFRDWVASGLFSGVDFPDTRPNLE